MADNTITEQYPKEYGQRYRILADKTRRIWKQLSFKTAAEDVYFSKNESESLPSIFGLTYETTLQQGETSCFVLASGGLTNDSRIEIYTNKYGLSPSDVSIDDLRNSIEITFTPQPEDVAVKVIVGDFVIAENPPVSV